MKRILATFLVMAIVIPAMASPVQQGIFGARADLAYDVAPGDDDVRPKTRVGLGYAAWTDIEVGGIVSFEQTEWESFWGVSDVWGLGVYMEYNYPDAQTMVPFAGLALSLLDGNNPDKDPVVVGTISAGLKAYPNNAIAITLQLDLELASEDAFDFDRLNDDEGEGNSYDVKASIGIRMYH